MGDLSAGFNLIAIQAMQGDFQAGKINHMAEKRWVQTPPTREHLCDGAAL